MKKANVKKLQELSAKIGQALAALQDVYPADENILVDIKDEEQETFDARSEKWQEGDTGIQLRENIDSLETASDALADAISSVDDCLDALRPILE